MRTKILIVVDMQKDFVDGALGTKEAVAIIDNVCKKIEAFDGDIYHILYSPKLEDDGTITLKESDKIDIQARIDSYAPQCDMAYIIAKLSAGDTSVLRSGGSYGDFTQMPKSFAEMLDLVRRSDAEFNALPTDIRAAFNNDVNQWFASAGSDAWYEKMKVGVPDAEVASPPADAS